MSDGADIELLHRVWEAMSGDGDLSVLEGALDPEAQWLGVEDGQICENRKMILTVMKRNLPTGFAGRIEETVEVDGRIVVAFRPDHARDDGRPLDQGIAYVVVTIRDRKIVELKGCADRAAAMTYAQTGAAKD
ncbi:MAG: hypothetical protein WBV85_03260 [Solirubrobacteraceae bacterium]